MGDAPGVGSRKTTPGHRTRGPVDGEQRVQEGTLVGFSQ